jgi:AcrR family transcriptional regulator
MFINSDLSRSERKKLEARDRILEAAEQLFLVEGSYEKTTIREIARRADVSVGAVYLHFATKVDILAALTAENVGRLLDLMNSMVPPDGTGREKFDASLAFLEELRTDRFFSLHDRLPFLRLDDKVNDVLRETLVTSLGEFVAINEGILKDGVADGTLRSDIDPHATALTLFVAVQSFIHELLQDSRLGGKCLIFPVDPKEMLRIYIDILKRAMIPPGSA